MSVIAQTADQDPVKLIKSNQDYVDGEETCEFTYEWTINNVECDEKEIKSPKFSSHYSDFDDEWILELDPTYRFARGMRCFSIELQPTSLNESNDTSKVTTKYQMTLIVDKEKMEQKNFWDLSKKVYWRIDYLGLTSEDVMDNDYFRNHEFKICCIIKMSKKITNKTVVIPKNIATQKLSVDWKKLLLSEKSADVTIKVGQKSFRVIKGILGARSPVFAAMFDHEEFKENKTNEVVIEDIDEGVFEEFLQYIYTGESPNIDKMPMELLAVAEKYQVDCLKNICEAILCETINFDNIASIFVCCDKYNLQKPNKKCFEFMKKNKHAVLLNKEFQVYQKKHPDVFVGILSQLLLSS